MAAPFVAGAAALLRQAYPTLPPSAIKHLLVGTARDFGLAGNDQGAGRVDLYRAATEKLVARARENFRTIANDQANTFYDIELLNVDTTDSADVRITGDRGDFDGMYGPSRMCVPADPAGGGAGLRTLSLRMASPGNSGLGALGASLSVHVSRGGCNVDPPIDVEQELALRAHRLYAVDLSVPDSESAYDVAVAQPDPDPDVEDRFASYYRRTASGAYEPLLLPTYEHGRSAPRVRHRYFSTEPELDLVAVFVALGDSIDPLSGFQVHNFTAVALRGRNVEMAGGLVDAVFARTEGETELHPAALDYYFDREDRPIGVSFRLPGPRGHQGFALASARRRRPILRVYADLGDLAGEPEFSAIFSAAPDGVWSNAPHVTLYPVDQATAAHSPDSSAWRQVTVASDLPTVGLWHVAAQFSVASAYRGWAFDSSSPLVLHYPANSSLLLLPGSGVACPWNHACNGLLDRQLTYSSWMPLTDQPPRSTVWFFGDLRFRIESAGPLYAPRLVISETVPALGGSRFDLAYRGRAFADATIELISPAPALPSGADASHPFGDGMLRDLPPGPLIGTYHVEIPNLGWSGTVEVARSFDGLSLGNWQLIAPTGPLTLQPQ